MKTECRFSNFVPTLLRQSDKKTIFVDGLVGELSIPLCYHRFKTLWILRWIREHGALLRSEGFLDSETLRHCLATKSIFLTACKTRQHRFSRQYGRNPRSSVARRQELCSTPAPLAHLTSADSCRKPFAALARATRPSRSPSSTSSSSRNTSHATMLRLVMIGGRVQRCDRK